MQIYLSKSMFLHTTSHPLDNSLLHLFFLVSAQYPLLSFNLAIINNKTMNYSLYDGSGKSVA
ncbi:unnamed protein product [Cuscuta europaea]|uniref:Uncharacterized protein n=1 Tax=Cuscuta europaea TaxID=41803 RepID=A0A9P0ZJQ8_CUSEU|nr:unnamed protein product [Cuscuta europaea]